MSAARAVDAATGSKASAIHERMRYLLPTRALAIPTRPDDRLSRVARFVTQLWPKVPIVRQRAETLAPGRDFQFSASSPKANAQGGPL